MELSSTGDQEWTKGCTLLLGIPSQDLILHSPQCEQMAMQETFSSYHRWQACQQPKFCKPSPLVKLPVCPNPGHF